MVGPLNSNLCLLYFARTRRRDDFVDGSGMVTLGCSGILVVSRFSSAILADLAMRGFAISFVTLVRVALSGSFLAFLCRSMHHNDIEI